MIPRFQYQHAAAAADDEAIAGHVIRARGVLRCVVAAGRQRTHRIEHYRHRPVQIFAATGKHDVLRTVADQVGRSANAMCGRCAGGADRITQAFDFECRGKIGRHRGAHRARHHVRADLAHATLAQDIGSFHLPAAGTTAGAGNQAGARVTDQVFTQVGLGDGITHGHIAVRRRIAHEAFEFAVDDGIQIKLDRTANLAAQAAFHRILQCADAGTALAQ